MRAWKATSSHRSLSNSSSTSRTAPLANERCSSLCLPRWGSRATRSPCSRYLLPRRLQAPPPRLPPKGVPLPRQKRTSLPSWEWHPWVLPPCPRNATTTFTYWRRQHSTCPTHQTLSAYDRTCLGTPAWCPTSTLRAFPTATRWSSSRSSPLRRSFLYSTTWR